MQLVGSLNEVVLISTKYQGMVVEKSKKIKLVRKSAKKKITQGGENLTS